LGTSIEDGSSYILRKDQVQAAFSQTGNNFDVALLPSLPPEVIAAMKGTGDDFAPGAVKLSDDLAEFYKFQHNNHGTTIAEQKRTLASTKGFTSTIDPHVLYSPP